MREKRYSYKYCKSAPTKDKSLDVETKGIQSMMLGYTPPPRKKSYGEWQIIIIITEENKISVSREHRIDTCSESLCWSSCLY